MVLNTSLLMVSPPPSNRVKQKHLPLQIGVNKKIWTCNLVPLFLSFNFFLSSKDLLVLNPEGLVSFQLERIKVRMYMILGYLHSSVLEFNSPWKLVVEVNVNWAQIVRKLIIIWVLVIISGTALNPRSCKRREILFQKSRHLFSTWK